MYTYRMGIRIQQITTLGIYRMGIYKRQIKMLGIHRTGIQLRQSVKFKNALQHNFKVPPNSMIFIVKIYEQVIYTFLKILEFKNVTSFQYGI